MQYRWRKSELWLKYLYGIIIRDPYYKCTIGSIIKQADLSHPKSYFEKYYLDTDNYSFLSQKSYFYDDSKLVPTELINKLENLYLSWEDIDFFKQKLHMPKRFFSSKDLMRMLDDVINNINNPDILRIYKKLIDKRHNTYNIQVAHKNSQGELLITGMTIYDYIFNKNYINILQEFNAEDFFTLVHETMHGIFNILLIEANQPYDESKIFLEIEGNLGTMLGWQYLEEQGYLKDTRLARLAKIDSTLFLSSALIVGNLIFSQDSIDLKHIQSLIDEVMPLDRHINIFDDYESYIRYPLVDIIGDIVDYLIALELMRRPLKEAIDATIDIRLHNNNDMTSTLKKHNINFLNDDFSTLKKEYNCLK